MYHLHFPYSFLFLESWMCKLTGMYVRFSKFEYFPVVFRRRQCMSMKLTDFLLAHLDAPKTLLALLPLQFLKYIYVFVNQIFPYI